MLDCNARDALDKVRVRVISAHVLCLEPVGDGGCRLPAARIDFVTAEVDEIIRKDAGRGLAGRGGHATCALMQQVLNQRERIIVGRVERLQARGVRAELRVAGAPAASVSGLIELDDDAHTSLACILNLRQVGASMQQTRQAGQPHDVVNEPLLCAEWW